MNRMAALLEAVVAELNNEGWSLDFEAVREYRPRVTLADLQNLRVTVVPRSLVIEPSSRGEDIWEYQIDIAIQRKLSEDSSEEIDALTRLSQEIVSHFRHRRLAGLPSCVCVKVENDTISAVEHLDELLCFTGIVTLSFREAVSKDSENGGEDGGEDDG